MATARLSARVCETSQQVCTVHPASRRRRIVYGLWSRRAFLLHVLLLTLSAWMGACVTPSIALLEIVSPFRFQLQYAPAWFGTIVLPPGRVTAELQYAGDACETLLGSYPVRGKVALVDRGKCSFVQKVIIYVMQLVHTMCALKYAPAASRRTNCLLC